ncbi:hypothetical protein [Streptomyces sp. NPDC097610]
MNAAAERALRSSREASSTLALKKVLSECPGQKLPSGGNPTQAPKRFTAD